jgi:hypothetical protein
LQGRFPKIPPSDTYGLNALTTEGAAVCAGRILPAKNTLHAFAAKLTTIDGRPNSASKSDRHNQPQARPTNGDVPPARLPAPQAAETIDKSELAHI